MIQRDSVPLSEFYDDDTEEKKTPHKVMTIQEAQKYKEQHEQEQIRDNKSIEEIEREIAKKYNRKYLGWPCDIAQDITDEHEKRQHILDCNECLKLIQERYINTGKCNTAIYNMNKIITEKEFIELFNIQPKEQKQDTQMIRLDMW